MLTGLAIALSVFDPASYVVGLCAAAHERLDRGAVEVKLTNKGVYSTERATYSLAYDRRGFADLSIHRTTPFRVVVTPDTVFEIDQASRHYSKKTKPVESFDAAVRQSAGMLDELVASLLPSPGVRLWLVQMKIGPLWRAKVSNGRYVLTNDPGNGTLKIEADASTGLLLVVDTRTGGFGTRWELAYRTPPAQIGYQPGRGFTKVSEIRPSLLPPVYASTDAKAVCQRIFERYDHPNGLAYEVTSDDERAKVWIESGRVRQADAHSDWTVDKQEFKLLYQRRKVAIVGKTDMSNVVDTIAMTGSRIDPLLRPLMRGTNPFRLYFGQNTTVKLVGRTSVDGDVCAIVQALSQTTKIGLIVRERDGFVRSLTLTPIDESVTKTRTFRPLRMVPGDLDLKVPSGWKTEPLVGHAASPSSP